MLEAGLALGLLDLSLEDLLLVVGGLADEDVNLASDLVGDRGLGVARVGRVVC